MFALLRWLVLGKPSRLPVILVPPICVSALRRRLLCPQFSPEPSVKEQLREQRNGSMTTSSSFVDQLAPTQFRDVCLVWSASRLGCCSPAFTLVAGTVRVVQLLVEGRMALFFVHHHHSLHTIFFHVLSSFHFALFSVFNHVTIISSTSRKLCHRPPSASPILHQLHSRSSLSLLCPFF